MTRGRQVGGKVGFRLVHRHVRRRPAHRPEVTSDRPGACARATYTLPSRGSLIAIGCNWSKRKSHPSESNRRPTDYESVALPTELGWHIRKIKYLQERSHKQYTHVCTMWKS